MLYSFQVLIWMKSIIREKLDFFSPALVYSYIVMNIYIM